MQASMLRLVCEGECGLCVACEGKCPVTYQPQSIPVTHHATPSTAWFFRSKSSSVFATNRYRPPGVRTEGIRLFAAHSRIVFAETRYRAATSSVVR